METKPQTFKPFCILTCYREQSNNSHIDLNILNVKSLYYSESRIVLLLIIHTGLILTKDDYGD